VARLPRRADRLIVIGVLNVTPDSFSDGGRYTSLASAVDHGVQMRADGADLVDVGGESTRPGADRVDVEEEIRRVLPVITELAAAGVPMSVDTTRARVAAAALDAGASIVNDVSGGLADSQMLKTVASAGCPLILMHWRGPSRTMRQLAVYDDVVADVKRELAERAADAVSAGVDPAAIVLDPGLGFAKRAEHDWPLLAGLPELAELGFPLLVGASRKSFLGRLLAAPDGTPRPTAERDTATAAITALAAANGAWGVRVHEVRSSVDAALVAAAVGAAR